MYNIGVSFRHDQINRMMNYLQIHNRSNLQFRIFSISFYLFILVLWILSEALIWNMLRTVTGLALILFIPGMAWSGNTNSSHSLAWIEFIGRSLALSIVFIIILVWALWLLKISISPYSVVIGVSSITIIGFLLDTYFRKRA